MTFLDLLNEGDPEAAVRREFEESLAFAESLRLDVLKVTVGIRVYPGASTSRLG